MRPRPVSYPVSYFRLKTFFCKSFHCSLSFSFFRMNYMIPQNFTVTSNTQRIRSRLAAPRRVCGVGVRKTRRVLFSPDARPRGFLVDRSTLQSQCGINLHDITRQVTLPNFFRHSIHFHDYFRFSKSTSASAGQI